MAKTRKKFSKIYTRKNRGGFIGRLQKYLKDRKRWNRQRRDYYIPSSTDKPKLQFPKLRLPNIFNRTQKRKLFSSPKVTLSSNKGFTPLQTSQLPTRLTSFRNQSKKRTSPLPSIRQIV